MQTRPIALLLSFALGGLLDGFAGFGLLSSPGFPAHPAQVVLLSHFAACAIFAPGFLLLLPPAYRKDHWLSILLILGFSAPLPVLGPGLVFLFCQYVLKLARSRVPQSNYFFGDRQFSSGTDQSSGNSLTRSLLGHLRSPDIEVRRNAVLAAGRLEFKSAIPILRLAQQDSDEQVRIFARNTLGQITESLEGALKGIDSPGLTPQEQLDRAMFVAEQSRHYVNLGLISEGNRNLHLDKVLGLLSQSLAADPDNEKILCLLLKFSILARHIDQAKVHLLALKKLAPAPDVTLPWELELCFEDRDWQSLSRMLATVRRSHSQHPHLAKVYQFWLQNTQ